MQHQSIRLANRCNRLGGVWTLRSTYERVHEAPLATLAPLTSYLLLLLHQDKQYLSKSAHNRYLDPHPFKRVLKTSILDLVIKYTIFVMQCSIELYKHTETQVAEFSNMNCYIEYFFILISCRPIWFYLSDNLSNEES